MRILLDNHLLKNTASLGKVRPSEAESFKRWLSKRLRIYRKLYGKRHGKNVDRSAGVEEGEFSKGWRVPEDTDTEINIQKMVMVIFSLDILFVTFHHSYCIALWVSLSFLNLRCPLEEESRSSFPPKYPVDMFIKWGTKS